MNKYNNGRVPPLPSKGEGGDLELYRERVPAVEGPSPFSWREWEGEEELDIRQYIAVLLRRRWTILAIVVIVLFTATLSVFTRVPLYMATATVEISSSRPNVTPFRESERRQFWYQARDFISSQINVLKSRALAERVVERLELEDHPEYFEVPKRRFASLNPKLLMGRIVGGVRGVISGVMNAIFAPQGDVEGVKKGYLSASKMSEKERLAMMIRGGLSAAPLKRESNVIAISYVSPQPALASKIVNAAVEEFISLDMDRNIKAARLGKLYLEREIAKIQAKLEESEEKLNKFTRRNDIVFLNKVSSRGEGEDLITAKLSNIIQELSTVQAKRVHMESLYEQSLQSPESLPRIRQDPALTSLKQELNTLEAKYSNLSVTFTKEYPEVKRLLKQMGAVKQEIAQEKKRILASIKTEYLTVSRQEELLKKALKEQKAKASDLKQKAIDYNILKREVETNRRIYDLLLQRAKEMEVQAGAVISAIKPVDFAAVPWAPFSPRRARTLFLALMVGLMAGVFLAFFLEYLDNTVKSPEEVERLLRLPILGAVPSITFKKRKGEDRDEEKLVSLFAVNSPRSPAAEAFRMVRTSLMLAAPGEPPKAVLVTSPQMGSGKSFVSSNLALAYAQMEAKVLLVDCDLRRARLHKFLNFKANPGLSNYLAGRVDLGQVTHEVKGVMGDGLTMDFIPAGTVPPNPVELLNSKAFVHLLELLKGMYDHIVIDSPPIMGFADALVLSRVVDGTLLVIRDQQTPRQAARYARDQLIQVGGRVLGVVVNDVKVERGSYYYGKYSGYYYYYDKYYGYGSPELPSGK